MVRGGSVAPSTGRVPSVSQLRKKREKPYKVQLESVMAKRKKLKIHDIHGNTAAQTAPLNGFTYLPVGFADLAEECKEMSRRKDADVGVVSVGSSAKEDPSKISHHIYRIGYHFRTEIFDTACSKLGYAQRNGKLVKVADFLQSERMLSRFGSNFEMIDLTNRSDADKVKKYIRELFPRIPEADLAEIYERAWEEGKNTVGNAGNLSLSRQVQLATLARIRHTYTDYDRLLRKGAWMDARRAVEHRCLAKLIEWRGEHEHDTEELEEILRETIVIDDESDDDAGSPVEHSGAADSDSSLEIIQHTVAPQDLRVDPDEASHFGRLPRSDVAARKRAAVQARWENAKTESFGKSSYAPDAHAAQRVTVALDGNGMAPRAVEAGGTTYIRISPERPEQPSTFPYPGRAAFGGGATQGYGRGTAQVHHAPLLRPQHPQQHDAGQVYLDGVRNVQPGPQRSRIPAAMQSIERPYEIIDLVSPPRQRRHPDDTRTASMNVPFDVRRQHSTWSTSEANRNSLRDDQAHSHVSANSAMHDRFEASRAHSRSEIVDLTGAHTPPSAGRQILQRRDYREAQFMPLPGGTERVHHQPVFGQPAFPQTRSYFTGTPAVPPRPVHGAPSAVQSVPPFGAQLPQPDSRQARGAAFPYRGT